MTIFNPRRKLEFFFPFEMGSPCVVWAAFYLTDSRGCFDPVAGTTSTSHRAYIVRILTRVRDLSAHIAWKSWDLQGVRGYINFENVLGQSPEAHSIQRSEQQCVWRPGSSEVGGAGMRVPLDSDRKVWQMSLLDPCERKQIMTGMMRRKAPSFNLPLAGAEMLSPVWLCKC